MFISELNNPFVPYEVLEYLSDGNTVVRRKRKLQQIKGCLYCDEGKTYRNNPQRYYNLFLMYADHGIGVFLANISFREEHTVEYIFDQYTRDMQTLEQYCNILDSVAKKGGHIRDTDIEYIKLFNSKQAEYLANAKKQRKQKIKAEDEEKRKVRLNEYTQKVNQENERTQQIINNAISIIITGGTYQEESVQIWELVDNYPSHKEYSLTNHLSNIYGVKIPINVKGWIASKLCSVTMENGELKSYTRYVRSSKTFFTYMNQLINKVIITYKENESWSA